VPPRGPFTKPSRYRLFGSANRVSSVQRDTS